LDYLKFEMDGGFLAHNRPVPIPMIMRADSDLVEFWHQQTGESDPVDVAW
jgi:hypothetical protein